MQTCTRTLVELSGTHLLGAKPHEPPFIRGGHANPRGAKPLLEPLRPGPGLPAGRARNLPRNFGQSGPEDASLRS
eukprot:13828673-Alexandrium_andersonii.AAC.1